MKIFSLAFAFLLGLGLQSFTAKSNATAVSGDEKTAFVPLEEDPNDDELRKLLKRRYNLALDLGRVVETKERVEAREATSPLRGLEAQETLLETALEAFDDPKVHERLLVEHVARLEAIEDFLSVRAEAREAQFYASIRKITAEIRLVKFRHQMQAALAK